jgi:hypothetical protein
LGGSVSTAAASTALWSMGSASGGSTPVKIIEVVSPKEPPPASLVSGVAHCEQNRALPVFCAPHAGQIIPPPGPTMPPAPIWLPSLPFAGLAALIE